MACAWISSFFILMMGLTLLGLWPLAASGSATRRKIGMNKMSSFTLAMDEWFSIRIAPQLHQWRV
jgi:hypothetical protein